MTANVLLGLLSVVQVWLIGRIVGTLGAVGRDAFGTGGRLLACLPYVLGLIALLVAQKLLFLAIPYERSIAFARVKKKMTLDLLEAVNRIPPVL